MTKKLNTEDLDAITDMIDEYYDEIEENYVPPPKKKVNIILL